MDRRHWPNPRESIVLSGFWNPPTEKYSMINADGSWDASTEEAGVGVIARDCKGKVLWVQAEHTRNLFCASEAEGHALLLALEAARKMKLERVIFEVDSVEVYRNATIGPADSEWCQSWLHKAMDMLRENSKWTISLVSREANSLADLLAGKARREGWCWDSLMAVPILLSHLLADQ